MTNDNKELVAPCHPELGSNDPEAQSIAMEFGRTAQELSRDHVMFVLSRLPRVVNDILWAEGIYLAGGFIRDVLGKDRVSDCDLFFQSRDKYKHTKEKLLPLSETVPVNSEFADTIVLDGMLVQLIHFGFFSNLEECLSYFDFACCQAGVCVESGEDRGLVSGKFFHDLATKTLTYTDPPNAHPASSLLRIMKYLRRGWTISPRNFSKLVYMGVDFAKDKGVDLGEIMVELDPLTGRLRQRMVGRE